MTNVQTYEVIIGIVSILFAFVCMAMIIVILEKAKVESKVIKKALTVVLLLGAITSFLSLYIIYFN